mmetsp:Transcript_2857/g.9309  ORF Transcript_2857/g.9309 Transcript_2857/m.9309 type:complete len:213 (-) Transcript_2857:168-806(-)
MLFTDAGSKPLPRACQNKHTRSVSTKNATSSGNKYTAPPPLSADDAIVVVVTVAAFAPVSFVAPFAAAAEYPNLDKDFPFCFTTFASFNFSSHIATAMLFVDAFRSLDHAETSRSNCSLDCSVVFTLSSSLVGNFASGFSRSRSSEYFVALAPPLLNKCEEEDDAVFVVVVVVKSMVSNLLFFSAVVALAFGIKASSLVISLSLSATTKCSC